MFEQSLIIEKNGRKPWTVAAAFGLQVLLVAAAVTIPLLFVQQLPAERFSRLLLAPPPPPPPPPPAAAAVQRPSRSYQQAAIRTDEPEPVIPRQFDMSKLTTPRQIPKQIAQIQDAGPPPSAAGVAGGVAGGVPGGVPGGVAGGVIGGVAQGVPPPPPEKKAETPKAIRVGGAVQSAKLVRKVVPQYPPIAKQARVQGTVRLRAIVSENGSVEQLQLISGHPLLAQAAIQAVKQWQYKPTLLNGQPVQVITEVEVSFNLS